MGQSATHHAEVRIVGRPPADKHIGVFTRPNLSEGQRDYRGPCLESIPVGLEFVRTGDIVCAGIKCICYFCQSQVAANARPALMSGNAHLAVVIWRRVVSSNSPVLGRPWHG